MTRQSATAPRRRLPAAARRQALLDAALGEFSRRGYYLTQMEHVAAAAGVSKALVYQHSPSKEELFAAVAELVVDGFVQRLPEVIGQDALSAWRGAVRLLGDLVTENREAWALVVRHLDNPELGAPLRAFRAQVMAVLTEVLAGFYAPRPPTPPVTEEAVRQKAGTIVPLLVGALQGLLSWWLDHPEVSRAEVETAAVEFGWLGLDRLRRGETL